MFKIFPRRKVRIFAGDIRLFLRFLMSKKLINGVSIAEFEEKLSWYSGTKFALTTASGRAALEMIIKALQADKSGGEIVVPAFTFRGVVETIIKCGMKPVFVDIRQDDSNINEDIIEDKISEKTRAVLATHIFGNPCNIQRIMDIAVKHNIPVIEDCAQAIGARYDGKMAGSFGFCGFYSFDTTKPLNTYGGGAIITDNKEFYDTLKRNREAYPRPSAIRLMKKFVFTIFETFMTSALFFDLLVFPLFFLLELFSIDLLPVFRKYKNSSFKGNFTMKFSNYQAAVGLSRIRDIDMINESRSMNAFSIISKAGIENKSQSVRKNTRPVFFSLALRTTDARRTKRNLLYSGIDVDTFHNHDCSSFFEGEDFPVSNNAVDRIIAIPLYEKMSENTISYIAESIRKYMEKET